MGNVVTRIAPSPTGEMHIGTARTALFNWLYARGRGGRFLLRIEDTDRERSTPEATEAILTGMAWMGLDHDGDADQPIRPGRPSPGGGRGDARQGRGLQVFLHPGRNSGLP